MMAMMIFNDQDRHCHPERSEGSRCRANQILRCAQDDNLLPVLVVKNHYGHTSTLPYFSMAWKLCAKRA